MHTITNGKCSKIRLSTRYLVIGIYFLAVTGYLIWVNKFTIPVHLKVDEELYISMARSFHYEGKFAENGMVLNYSCVLYSMLLSLAYFFYTPESIVFGMRTIGVCIMLSSIFPVYLLADRIIKKESYALGVTVLFCFMPSVADVAYCMQEVLCYPLFLWMFYFIYRETEQNKLCKISKYTPQIALLGVLCYFTKTYMLFIMVAYIMHIIVTGYMEREKKTVAKVLLLMVISILLYLGGELFIDIVNDGVTGSNHYFSQFTQLFPITDKTIIAAVSSIVFYVISFLFYMGVIPVILPVYNKKNYKKTEQNIINFLMWCIVILVLEIVISIVLTEEGIVFFPHKFLYRYFQILEIPILILFISNIHHLKVPKWMGIIYGGIYGYLIIYYVYIKNDQRTAIIDAPVFLLMENITKYVCSEFNILVCILAAVTTVVGFQYCRKRGITYVLKRFVCLYIIGIALFFIINMVQLPYYTNQIANGKELQKEAIEVAEYYGGHREEFDKVYYIENENDKYSGALYAYFPIEILKISKDEIVDKVDDRSLCITTLETDFGWKPVRDIQNLKIYHVGIGSAEDITIYGE